MSKLNYWNVNKLNKNSARRRPRFDSYSGSANFNLTTFPYFWRNSWFDFHRSWGKNNFWTVKSNCNSQVQVRNDEIMVTLKLIFGLWSGIWVPDKMVKRSGKSEGNINLPYIQILPLTFPTPLVQHFSRIPLNKVIFARKKNQGRYSQK